MKIRVDDITEQPKILSFQEPSEAFPSLAELQATGESEFLSPLMVELAVSKEYGHIRVKGSVTVKIRFVCSRCLVPFDADISSAFTMFYSEGSLIDSDEDEIELAEEDLISVFYEGDEIDFAPEIAEQVIMELPLKPLCGEGCKGLCVTCGADLNEGDCGCERTTFNLKFSALKNFKVEK
ncbi:YceD family protein [Geobacter grbiciae]|uniref:YceD family protein n=1 Tax=Geobacter grbiciae TaxID=155042 RepID=UPI001C02E6C8|nr:DUF177 domain-containing protein [Geobacter grbiciae]MBT1075863.1 DUF177 domain-containing protein [Geobacter grbiciae]